MRNFVQNGDVVSLTAPSALASGDGFIVGAIFAVATGDAENGAPVEGLRVGVVDMAKATGQAWTVGQKLYWDNTAKKVTNVATANTFIGAALLPAITAATTGRVLLAGAPLP